MTEKATASTLLHQPSLSEGVQLERAAKALRAAWAGDKAVHLTPWPTLDATTRRVYRDAAQATIDAWSEATA